MGKSCCIEGCMVARDDVEYFTFPVSKTLRAAWTEACGRAGDSVCAAHFTEEDYKCTRGTRRLRAAAVPSVALNKTPLNTSEKRKASTDTKKKQENKTQCQDKSVEEASETSTEVEQHVEASIKKRETVEVVDTRQAGVHMKNGMNEKCAQSLQTEEKDIEEMITNYQIKQTKSLAERLNPPPLEELIPSIASGERAGQLSRQAACRLADRLERQLASALASRLDDRFGEVVLVEPDLMDAAPVFIEIATDKDARRSPGRAGSPTSPASPADCVMLLESVQCDVDPSSLMLPHHAPDADSDMEIVDVKTEELNPISLLTSSDEDEVIIEEPHIDTVEVSSETDEDDRPLTRLIKKPKPVKKTNTTKEKYLWGVWGEFACAQCDYRTSDESNFKRHNVQFEHSTALQVCPSCSYTTASKAQFARHKRKHRDERNFKCHLCKYKARHHMSLVYHLKSHSVGGDARQPVFSCGKCGFSSNVQSEGSGHIKKCKDGRFFCGACDYSTKRRSDLKRHKSRRHSAGEDGRDGAA